MNDDDPTRHRGKMAVHLDDEGRVVLAVKEDGIRLEFDYDNALAVAGYIAHAAYRSRGVTCTGVTILPLETPPPAQDGQK